MIRSVVLSLGVLLAAAPVAWALPELAPSSGVPVGTSPVLEEDAVPKATGTLDDPDFGVSRASFGLDRQVEMYQWRLTDEGYRQVWNSALIDASGFDAGHRNPPMPLDSARWWAKDATLAGHPLDVEVLRALGKWKVFRPGFSRLPLNMAATFQPDGDGLGSAENPLQPQVGDLRIHWRELVLPPLQGQVAFRDGAWRLRRSAAPGTRLPTDAPGSPADVRATSPMPADRDGWNWSWAALGLIALFALLVLRRRRRR